jgi:hypothetical protein
VLDNSGAVQAVASTVGSLQPDSGSTVSTVLPASSADTLLNAVNLATVASGSRLVEINTATTGTTGGGTATTPVNHAPVIGATGRSVMAGKLFFQPVPRMQMATPDVQYFGKTGWARLSRLAVLLGCRVVVMWAATAIS